MAIFLMQRKRRQSFSHSNINNIEEFKYRSNIKDLLINPNTYLQIIKKCFLKMIGKDKLLKYLSYYLWSQQYFNKEYWAMSSLKDKIKSKLKSPLSQPETMDSFDQNSVNVTFTQGKTQLSQIKLQCLWSNKTNMKIPKLKCIWYNRTENNLQQISGVEDEMYQPSIIDVGSIIQITCIPELQGVSYEGMPIQLKTSIISLAVETQNQSSHLLAQGRAKFFVEVKQAKLKNRSISYGCDSLLKIEGFKLILCQMKFGQLNDDILKQMTVDELYPQIVVNRRQNRQITIKFNQEQFCVINFKNHQVRDTFCLLNKLMVAKIGTSKPVEKPTQDKKQIKIQPIQNPIIQVQKQQRKVFQELPALKQQVKVQNIIKQPGLRPIQNTKHSTVQLLQLTNLKQEIKQMEVANAKLVKQLDAQKDKNFNLQNKISQTTERLQNASKNYFQLEKQLNLAKAQLQNFKRQVQQKVNTDSNRDEQLLYYKNEIKLISTQNAKLAQSKAQVTFKYQQIIKEVQNYRKLFNSNQEESKSFSELEEELKNIKDMNNQLKLRYQYSLSEKDKIEQDLKNSRNLIEQIEAQKRYIERKYESLSSSINSPTLSKSRISDDKSSGQHASLASSYVFQEIPSLDRQNSTNSVFSNPFNPLAAEIQYKEKEIADLKRKVKDLVEENAYLRTLINKQKKSSTSKTQLKLQLFQAKKIVNRLSQALIQKDMSINNLKQINKQLNKKNSELEQIKSSV